MDEPNRIDISDPVKAHLAPDRLAEIAALVETTGITCFICEERVPPAAGQHLSLSLISDPIERTLATRFAHLDCSPSQVDVVDLPAAAVLGLRDSSISFVQALVEGFEPLLIWERNLRLAVADHDGKLVYPHLQGYVAGGFDLHSQQVERLPGWSLELAGEDLILRQQGSPTDSFQGAKRAAPAGWFEALRATGLCLATVVAAVGLDRLEPERLDRARVDGRAAIGLVEVVEP